MRDKNIEKKNDAKLPDNMNRDDNGALKNKELENVSGGVDFNEWKQNGILHWGGEKSPGNGGDL